MEEGRVGEGLLHLLALAPIGTFISFFEIPAEQLRHQPCWTQQLLELSSPFIATIVGLQPESPPSEFIYIWRERDSFCKFCDPR